MALFCPVNEAQLLSFEDDGDISAWAQGILPRIREVYSGEVAFLVQGSGEGVPEYDVSGYDYIAYGGIACSRDIEEHLDWISNLIAEQIGELRETYTGHRLVLFGTMGFTGPDYYWWEPIAPENVRQHSPDLPADFFVISEQGQADFYSLLFTQTWEDVGGLFHRGL